MTIRRVLVLTRPFLDNGLRTIAKAGLSAHEVTFASDWRGVGDVWIMEPFYRTYQSNVPTCELPCGLDDFEIADIIDRCRLLRSLPTADATRMVVSMWHAAQDLLDARDPDLIISSFVDCYVYDVIARAQAKRSKAYVAIGTSMLSGYGEVNYRFDALPLREPSDDEVATVVAKIRGKQARPPYMLEAYYRRDYTYRFVRFYLRHKARQLVYPVKKLVDRDPLNFHLNTPTTGACLHEHWLRTDQFFAGNWAGRVRETNLPKVFVPLQFYPESRYDYSRLHRRLADIPALIQQICSILGDRCLLLVKEHPAVSSSRAPEYYQTLLRNPNVVLIHPNVDAFDVLGVSDVVVTPGSTIGFEATVLGKRVISIGRSPYHVDGALESVTTPRELQDLPRRIEQQTMLSDDAPQAVTRRLLSQLLPGGCPIIRFRESDASASAQLRQFGVSFGEHLEEIGSVTARLGMDWHVHGAQGDVVPK